MTGKEKCRKLRQIRIKIAKANDIPFHENHCDYQGDDCSGTCEMCEKEVQFLEMALNQKRQAGKSVNLEHLSDKDFQFLSQDTSAWEDQDLVIELPEIPDEIALDRELLFAKLKRVGITKITEILPFTSRQLQEKCDLTDQETEQLHYVIRSCGKLWKDGTRRPRRDNGVRGRMRCNRGFF